MPKFYSDLGLLRAVRMTFTQEPYLQVYGETTDDQGRLLRLDPSIIPISLGPADWIYQITFNVNEDAVALRMIWNSSETPDLVSYPDIYNYDAAALAGVIGNDANRGRGARGAQSSNETVQSDADGVFITRVNPSAAATRYASTRVFLPDNDASMFSSINLFEPSSGTAVVTHNVYGGPDDTVAAPFMSVEVTGGVATFSRQDVTSGRLVPLGTAQTIQPTAAELAVTDWTIGLEFGRLVDTFTGYVFPAGGGRILVDVSSGPSDEIFFTTPQVITGTTSGASGTLIRAITYVTVDATATGPFQVGELVTAAPSGATGTVLATTVVGGVGGVLTLAMTANTNFDYATPDTLTGGVTGDTADVASATQELVLTGVTGQFLDAGAETCSGSVDNTVAAAILPDVLNPFLWSVTATSGAAIPAFAQVMLPEICMMLPGTSSTFANMRVSGWRYLAAEFLLPTLIIVPIPDVGPGSYLDCLLAEWDMEFSSEHTILVPDAPIGGLVAGDTIDVHLAGVATPVVFSGTLTADLGVHPASPGGGNGMLLEAFGLTGAGAIAPGVSEIEINGGGATGIFVDLPIVGAPGAGLAPLGVDDATVFPGTAGGAPSAGWLDGAGRLVSTAISADVDLVERFVNLNTDFAVIPTTLLFEVLSVAVDSEAASPATAVNSPPVDGANATLLGVAGGVEIALGTDGAAGDRQNDDTTSAVLPVAAENILVSTGGVLVAGILGWADLIPFAIGAVKRIEISGDPDDQVFSAVGRGDQIAARIPPAVASTGLNAGPVQFSYSGLSVRCRLYGTVVDAV